VRKVLWQKTLSTVRDMYTGAKQGGPLSAWLFIMVMSVAMRDIEAETREVLDAALTELFPFPTDVEFSDDTTLLHTDHSALQAKFLFTNQEYDRFLGANSMHRDKTKHMALTSLPNHPRIQWPDGTYVQTTEEEKVVGGVFTRRHSNYTATIRRLTVGNKLMGKYKPVWQSAKIGKMTKAKIVRGAPETATAFGLSTLHLTETMHKKLDSWQARQHRRALKIPPTFIGRTSNERVLAKTRSKQLSYRVAKLRIKFFAHIYRTPHHNELRKLIFSDLSTHDEPRLRRFQLARGRGRPRARWDDLALSESQALANALKFSTAEFLRKLKKDSVQKKAFTHLPPPSGTRYASADDLLF